MPPRSATETGVDVGGFDAETGHFVSPVSFRPERKLAQEGGFAKSGLRLFSEHAAIVVACGAQHG